jgi:hypothetical protein
MIGFCYISWIAVALCLIVVMLNVLRKFFICYVNVNPKDKQLLGFRVDVLSGAHTRSAASCPDAAIN